MEPTLGKSNPIVRRLRRFRRDPALRRGERVLVAEGLHLTREALDSGAEIELVVTSDRLDRSGEGQEIIARLRSDGLPCWRTSDAILDSLQDARSAQPILAVVRRPTSAPAELWCAVESGRSGPLVVAHGLTDPGNLGTLWRSADAAEAAALLVSGGGADPFHPRAIRASMGSVFRLPLIEASIADCIAAARGAGARLLGAVPRDGADFRTCRMTGPLVLIFGGEADGLPDDLLARCDERISIPMARGVESLSVAAAAAVVLFESARQRGS